MSKTNELEKLFEEWQMKCPCEIFCKDGIVDERIYDEQEIKVLYVLKDLHLDQMHRARLVEKGECCIDIKREGLEDGVGRTWNPLALWTKSLTDKEARPFVEIKSEIQNKKYLREENIVKIAFLNVKKEAGESYVSDNTIGKYLEDEDNINFIKKEIDICSPDVIIVCGVNLYYEVIKALELKREEEIQLTKSKRGVNYIEVGSKKIPVIQFRHPSRSGSYENTYNDMLKIRELFLGK